MSTYTVHTYLLWLRVTENLRSRVRFNPDENLPAKVPDGKITPDNNRSKGKCRNSEDFSQIPTVTSLE